MAAVCLSTAGFLVRAMPAAVTRRRPFDSRHSGGSASLAPAAPQRAHAEVQRAKGRMGDGGWGMAWLCIGWHRPTMVGLSPARQAGKEWPESYTLGPPRPSASLPGVPAAPAARRSPHPCRSPRPRPSPAPRARGMPHARASSAETLLQRGAGASTMAPSAVPAAVCSRGEHRSRPGLPTAAFGRLGVCCTSTCRGAGWG